MSNLYKKYLSLKIEDSNNYYLFESGIFYIFIAEDAKFMSQLLNLKLTNLNSYIVKCGFPATHLNKYLTIINKSVKFPIKIVTSDSFLAYSQKDYFSNQNSREFLRKVSSIDTNSLSISEAFELLEELASEATDIINEIEREF